VNYKHIKIEGSSGEIPILVLKYTNIEYNILIRRGIYEKK